MFFDEILKYKSQYNKGIKSISFCSHYPKIDRKSYTLEIKESSVNYDLYFDKRGQLTEIHLINDFKIIFGYFGGKLVTASKYYTVINIISELTQYYYDKKCRIKKEIQWNFHSNFRWNDNEKALHTYTDDSEIIFLPKSKTCNDSATFISRYDINGRIIEDKAHREHDDLMWWYKKEYNSAGELIRQFSFDENGMQDGVYEYFPYKNGLTTGYHFKSHGSNYRREITYSFNKRGDWISQVIMNDGEPKWFYDRKIEYY